MNVRNRISTLSSISRILGIVCFHFDDSKKNLTVPCESSSFLDFFLSFR